MPELVVFLNKVDLLKEGDEELKELVEMEVRACSRGSSGPDYAGRSRTRGKPCIRLAFEVYPLAVVGVFPELAMQYPCMLLGDVEGGSSQERFYDAMLQLGVARCSRTFAASSLCIRFVLERLYQAPRCCFRASCLETSIHNLYVRPWDYMQSHSRTWEAP